MKRRKFIAGAGGVSLGGSGLIGSGAFSRVESQRQITVEAAEDPDAYLGLDACATLHGDNYVEINENGHLEIDMGDNPNGGEGVNSNSESFFDNVFRITNQGKEKACVWIDADVHFDETSVPVIDFYVIDDDGDQRSIRGVEQSVGLDVGSEFCVGIRTYTQNLSEGDTLLKDDKVTINADVDPDDDIDCPQINGEVPPANGDVDPERAISFVAFCGSDLNADSVSPTVDTRDDDGEPLTVSWNNVAGLETVVIFGAAQMWWVDPGASPAGVGDGEFVSWQPGGDPSPSRPCPGGECGPKFDYVNNDDDFEAVGHRDQCRKN